MASKITIRDNSKEIISLLNKAKHNGLEAIGLSAEGHAKKITPVDTGNLRNSITHLVDGKAAYIGTNVEYAPTLSLARQKWRRDRISSPPQRSTVRNIDVCLKRQ